MIQVYTGDGHGKSPAALGTAVRYASEGKTVVVIQFLKGKNFENHEFWTRLEPEVKLFSFEKSEKNFCDLSEAEKEEAIVNIRNGLNYAKKVLSTDQCDLLILDEVLGLVDYGIISTEELKDIISSGSSDIDIIMTGIESQTEILQLADEVSKIETVLS